MKPTDPQGTDDAMSGAVPTMPGDTTAQVATPVTTNPTPPTDVPTAPEPVMGTVVPGVTATQEDTTAPAKEPTAMPTTGPAMGTADDDKTGGGTPPAGTAGSL